MTRFSIRLLTALLFAGTLVTPASAQEDDAVFRPAEPDFTLIGLPTSLRLPLFKGAFRVSHRFLRPLAEGDFGDLAGDLFGLDSGAAIALEYRFGIVPGGQVGFHRASSNKTIEFFGQYGLLRQSRAKLDVSAIASIEGTDNFKGSRSPMLGVIVSRTLGEWAAVYVEPEWVNNTNGEPKALVDHNDTVMVGVGARVRIRPTVYLTGEFAPRVSGFEPGVNHGGFAIEKRAGGHVFQLNFSNSLATTAAQIARGGQDSSNWYLGFNLSRKFF